ncbi:MAG: sugar phosphate isomerase/epimerase family protein [Candidatus Thorarchaeota archaeon]
MVYKTSLHEALDYASGTVWNGIVPDFGVPELSPEKVAFYERMQLRQRSHELGIEWGFHAPGDDVSLMCTYPPIRNAILEYFRDIIDFARDLSETRTNIVIHAGTPPSFKQVKAKKCDFTEKHSDLYLQTLCDNLDALVTHSKVHANIVLENSSWNPIVREAIDRMVPRGLKLCLDIPKLYAPKLNEDDWAVFEKHKDVIEVVHVHDRSDLYGVHQIVGDGSIPFERPLRLLAGLEKPALYIFEVRPREAAEKSLLNFVRITDSLDISL